MGSLLEQSVGITPPGALGVSLYYHLTHRLTRVGPDVFFIARPGSSSTQEWRRRGALTVEDEKGRHRVPLGDLRSLGSCWRAGRLPEVLLVCPNPDQMLEVVTSYVRLLERVHEEGHLLMDPIPVPALVLSSNGIYFQRIRQVFIEKVEEATMYGRLPDLWPDAMPRIVARLLRGVTIQTGVREGAGSEAIYRPGPSGLTMLAGGGEITRRRCHEVLTGKGAWVELAVEESPTRLEFNKAMINLVSNLLGQIYAIDAVGRFRALRVEEITIPEHEPEMRRLAETVFRVGKAVKAFDRTEEFEPVFQRVLHSCARHRRHIPSSLQWVEMRLRLGKLEPKLTPTEAWLLEPLIRYARSAGLDSDVTYFEELKKRLLEKLALASRA